MTPVQPALNSSLISHYTNRIHRTRFSLRDYRTLIFFVKSLPLDLLSIPRLVYLDWLPSVLAGPGQDALDATAVMLAAW